MKKGETLAVNNLVLIILAVVVLVAVLLVIVKMITPGTQNIDLQRQKEQLCSIYSFSDPGCNEPDMVDDTLAVNLSAVCQKLDFDNCTGSLTTACLKQCCTVQCG